LRVTTTATTGGAGPAASAGRSGLADAARPGDVAVMGAERTESGAPTGLVTGVTSACNCYAKGVR
jgi:hypothetical protein